MDAEDRDSPAQVADFASKRKLTHRILVGGSRAADLYEFARVFPTTFWIDHRGRVVRRDTGFRPEMEKEIERTIQDLLRARDAEAGKAPAGAPPEPPAGTSSKPEKP